MSSEALKSLEMQIAAATYDEKLSLLLFMAEKMKEDRGIKKDSIPPVQKKRDLQLGGLEEGFWIADDFDETPDCMAAYV